MLCYKQHQGSLRYVVGDGGKYELAQVRNGDARLLAGPRFLELHARCLIPSLSGAGGGLSAREYSQQTHRPLPKTVGSD